MATGCEKQETVLLERLSGDWHYEAEENGVTEDIWLSFTAAGTFEMYQKIGEGPYWYSNGEFTLDPDSMTLSGIYSDRYPWRYTYRISIGGSTLDMTAVEAEDYKVTYSRESIPAQVRDMSLPLTKAGQPDVIPFL